MKALIHLAAALLLTSCGTTAPEVREETRSAIARLATTSITIGEAAVAAQLGRLATRVISTK